MPDMRRLVGIDARMLDQSMTMLAKGLDLTSCGNSLHSRIAIQSCIDVPGTGYFKAGESLDATKRSDDFLGYLPGSLSQVPCQLKGNRRCVLAEPDLWRLLNDVAYLDLV